MITKPLEAVRPVCRFGAYSTQSLAAVRSTLADFRYLDAFLASTCERCPHPFDSYARREGVTWTKTQARDYLKTWIDNGINRKLADPRAKWRNFRQDADTNFRRDQQSLKNIHNRLRVYQFATKHVRERFTQLLSSQED